MIIPLSDELIDICEAIADQAYTPAQWARLESDDMFQGVDVVGGYDASEKAFTFSYYDSDDKEWWFQLTTEGCERDRGWRLSRDLGRCSQVMLTQVEFVMAPPAS